MKIFNREINFNISKSKPLVNQDVRGYNSNEYINPVLGTLNYINSNYTDSKALKISSVYRAVNVISDAVAVLPLDTYTYSGNWKTKEFNNLYYLLNVQPNINMSAVTFKKAIVQNILLKGNCYIHIIREGNSIKAFEILNPDTVQVVLVNNVKKYQVINTNTLLDDYDVIHIMNYSNNNLVGISTLSYASMSLGTAYNSEEYASNFFSGGGTLAGILRPVAGVNMTGDKARSAKESFLNSLNSDLGGKSNSVVVLDSGLEYQSISISPADAQLLESRQFNILSIAQWFGVPPSKLFDLSAASYASAESSQIDFLNSTLLPLLEKIELEFYRKIYLPIEYSTTELKFDVSNLLRLDQSTQATVFSQLFNIGAMSVNEIREKLNANYPATGGNRLMIGQQMQPLDNLLNDLKASGSTKQ